MGIFNEKKTLNRLNRMLDNAINGENIEQGFDESMLSALETKLSKFLKLNSLAKTQLLEEKQKMNSLISDISHQTKTPLANILLYSELLQESSKDEKANELIQSLSKQAEKLEFLITSLVKISRLETGIIEVSPKENSVKHLIEQAVAQAKPKAKLKNIEVSINFEDINAKFDAKWTVEALFNIIDNGIKYNTEHGTIKITVNKYNLFYKIDISDSGIGIKEDDIPKIFARFYRCENSNIVEGVGIGLYLAREIISLQGGYIKVKSIINCGTTFSVFLPL